MRYFVTYVRQLPFNEEPDYEFLDHCLNFGKYALMAQWHAQLKQLTEPAEEAAPAAAGGASGAKRKRERSDTGEEERAGAKKVKTEPPQEPCRAFMWFVISNNPLEGREAYTSHTTYQVRQRAPQRGAGSGLGAVRAHARRGRAIPRARARRRAASASRRAPPRAARPDRALLTPAHSRAAALRTRLRSRAFLSLPPVPLLRTCSTR